MLVDHVTMILDEREASAMLTWENIIADESAPYWARDLALDIRDKDPVDVLNVLEVLVGVASRHLATVQGR